MSLDFAQTNHKTVSRYNFVAKLDIVGRVCLWWWARFRAASLFFEPGGHRREFHKQKESASLSCFKVPTAGD